MYVQSVIREQKDDEGQGRSAFVSRKTHRVKGQPAKLDGTRRSAKDCRGRRKLRYQYLEDMVTHRERAIQSLRRELETVSLLVDVMLLFRLFSALVMVVIIAGTESGYQETENR